MARTTSRALGVSFVLALAACGGSNSGTFADTGSNSSVDGKNAPFAEGGYEVTASGDTLATGTLFFNPTLAGFLVLEDDSGARPAGSGTVIFVKRDYFARRVPSAGSPVTITYLRSVKTDLRALAAAELAGTYDTLVAGQSLRLVVAADGTLGGAAGNACPVGGRLDPSVLYGNAIKATLVLGTGCSQAPGEYAGIAWRSSDLPARWRLVAENGSSVVDLLALR